MKFRKKKEGTDTAAWLDWLKDDAPSASSEPVTSKPDTAGKWLANVRSAQTPSPKKPVNQSFDSLTSAAPAVQSKPVRELREQPLRPSARIAGPAFDFRPKTPALFSKSKPSTPEPKKTTGQINIQITLPHGFSIKKLFHKLVTWLVSTAKTRFAINWSRSKAFGVIGACCLLVVGGGIWAVMQGGDEASGVRGASKEVTEVKPDYEPVVPVGKKPEDVSARYDPEKKVVSFQDKIGLINVTVSQQPLPKNFDAGAQAELAKLAESISAKEVIELDNGEKAYVGTSGKGPQTAVAVRRDMLMFVFSASKVPNNQWADYISGLK